MKPTIHLAADHAGFELKERTKAYLVGLGYRVKDHGAYKADPKDDYPFYMIPAAQAVARTRGRGIFFGGSGLGECIVANKVRGIRAVAPYDAYTAKMSRRDNDANVICFGARTRPAKWSSVRKLIVRWLKTPFSGAERHQRRLQELAAFEKDPNTPSYSPSRRGRNRSDFLPSPRRG